MDKVQQKTDGQPAPQGRRVPIGFFISSLIIFSMAGFLLYDWSAVFFYGRYKAEALKVIDPAMRLTEAERALNSAGYITSYDESHAGEPQVVVSLMKHRSYILRALQKGPSALGAYRPLRQWVSEKSSFALIIRDDKIVATEAPLRL